MSSHLMTRHGKAAGDDACGPPQTESRAEMYRISFLMKGLPRRFPVDGCPEDLAKRMAIRVRIVHQHVQDTVVMLEEGKSPHPRCARCDMQVPRKALNGRHLGTAQCAKGDERKRRRLAETETRENSSHLMTRHGKAVGRRRLWNP